MKLLVTNPLGHFELITFSQIRKLTDHRKSAAPKPAHQGCVRCTQTQLLLSAWWRLLLRLGRSFSSCQGSCNSTSFFLLQRACSSAGVAISGRWGCRIAPKRRNHADLPWIRFPPPNDWVDLRVTADSSAAKNIRLPRPWCGTRDEENRPRPWSGRSGHCGMVRLSSKPGECSYDFHRRPVVRTRDSACWQCTSFLKKEDPSPQTSRSGGVLEPCRGSSSQPVWLCAVRVERCEQIARGKSVPSAAIKRPETCKSSWNVRACSLQSQLQFNIFRQRLISVKSGARVLNATCWGLDFDLVL